MILINKNTSNNNLILTLSEKGSLLTPYYLFQFISQATNSCLNFICSDISTAKTAYNKFIIYETGTTFQNLTAGTVNLQEGWHSYNVYEQNSNTNLYVTGTTGVIIETGLAFISGTSSQVQFTKSNENITYTY